MGKVHVVLIVLLSLNAVYGQDFTDISAGLTGVGHSEVSWGDYDNDGDLDILLTGLSASGTISKIYRNDTGVFTDINAGLTDVFYGSVAWGDYDNDGDLDILLSGNSISKIYRNDSGVFTDINAGLTGVVWSSAAWGDYDNDGDLDILLTGSGSSYISKIYRNNNGVFTDINAGLQGVYHSSVAWGDYDNDGDLDILLTGNSNSGMVSKIYRNDNGVFTDINAVLANVLLSSVAWGDYDNDRDLDILLTGFGYSKIYRNDNGVFTDIYAGLTGVSSSSVAWGDYDNDGDLDILLSGYQGLGNYISKIYRNDNGVFTDINAGLTGVTSSSATWGDYDNDGDLDILLTGDTGSGYISKVYKKNSLIANTKPSAPAGLNSVFNGSEITLNWNNAADAQTPQDGLSYNLYVGTSPLSGNTKSPLSNISTGYRKVVSLGNAGSKNSYTIKGLPFGIYYWSVQAVDNAYSGSLFSEESSFALVAPPIAITANNISYTGFTANWNSSAYASGYYIDVATDSLFTNYISGYQNKDVNTDLNVNVSGLPINTICYYRVRAYNADRVQTASSNIIKVMLLLTQFTDINSGLTGVDNSSVDWGDYDNDGDLDILLTGNAGTYVTVIYSNNNDLFTDINSGLTGVGNSSAAWGDYDNDGDLDILLTGLSSTGRISKLYRNDNGVFSDINAGLIGVDNSSIDWGDLDNDGDLDILLTGSTGSVQISKIYQNHNGEFTDINAGLVGVYFSSAKWGDFDNDGDLDIVLTGSTGSAPISKIYRNDSGIFTDINAGLTGVFYSSADWGDYDNDGDADLVITGATGAVGISKIYRNDSGSFNDINAGLTGVYNSSADWGDYDNDGDLDILITGATGSSRISYLYRNDYGIFTDMNANLTGVSKGSAAWGDYENDGDLDILLTGYTGTTKITKINKNNNIIANTIPISPANLFAKVDGSDITLSWDKSTDAQTPQNGLSYNLYVGTSPLTGNKKSSMSNISTGYRKVLSMGNAGQGTSWTIKDIPEGTYYWSVQAVDNAYSGSLFGEEKTFTVDLSIPSDVNVVYSAGNVTVTWNAVPGAISYKVYASEDPFGVFADVSSSGTFDGTSWSQAVSVNKLFYYVVAVTAK